MSDFKKALDDNFNKVYRAGFTDSLGLVLKYIYEDKREVVEKEMLATLDRVIGKPEEKENNNVV
jgi:hypothetical protein